MSITIHFVLQKKGGSGKSLIASTLFQYLTLNGHNAVGIDIDPSNKTFAKYVELKVTKLEILGKDKKVDPILFDVMLETIFALPEGTHVVIDSGASCFHDLMSYITESKVLSFIIESGHQVYFHVPIVGGPGTVFSLECLAELMKDFKNIPMIVWKNLFFGEINIRNKSFEEFDIYLEHQDRIEGVIDIPQKNPGTFGKDIQAMQSRGLTYDAAINGAMVFCCWTILMKSWLNMKRLPLKSLKMTPRKIRKRPCPSYQTASA